ncbi:uncharacterized protein ACR2FA_006777 [Aphomia sociella]
MAIIPIKLEDGNLGERHKSLNYLVNEAFKNNIDFASIKDTQEDSPLDRLFKIDLASKYRNLSYILDTLKDNELIFVSRALKCRWLIQEPEYSNIINPIYLEKELFPEMLTTSVNKMKHWILLNLKDKYMCQAFYEFYKEKDMRFAMKFFPKCSSEFIMEEIEEIPENDITPHFLKLLCEHSPKIAEIHLKNRKDDINNICKPINNDNYINRLQFLLKSDPDTYFYLIENIYDKHFKRLNKDATKYIMKNHRNRFDSKPELYTARILNVPALAKFLNNEEIKDLVMKCARAEYLGYSWFSYKFAEPLLKHMDPKEKSSFCKKVFNEKSIGEKVTEPPYYIPSRPNYHDAADDICSEISDGDYDVYLDCEMYYGGLGMRADAMQHCLRSCHKRFKLPTLLDKLFDQYRFSYFEETFAELTKRIPKESVLSVRQYLMLVLVSKTGGQEDHLEKLLHFLVTKHSNEAVSLRATIVRSLVKRACVWRLKDDNWDMFLKFGRDLGLDGSPSEIACSEGLHAVVLHNLFQTGSCKDVVFTAYLKEFSSLNEYSLKSAEKQLLLKTLPKLMLNKIEIEPDKAAERLNQLLDVFSAFKFPIEQCSGVVSSIASTFRRDPVGTRPVLQRLYETRVARKELFKEYFEIIQTDESYLNALRHDVQILISGNHFEKLLLVKPPQCHERFLRKLYIYFNKETQILEHYQNCVMRAIETKPHVKLARIAALLANAGASWPVSVESTGKTQKQLETELRRVSHLVKSHSAIEDTNSKKRNLTKISNWIHTCSEKSLRNQMAKLILEPRVARLVLALRTPGWPGLIGQTMLEAVKSQPSKTVRVAIRVLRKHGEHYQQQDWEALKNILMKINMKNRKQEFYNNIARMNSMPKTCKLNYCLIVYEMLEKEGFGSDNGPHYGTALALLHYLNDNIDKANGDYLQKRIKHFLDNNYTFNNLNNDLYSQYVSIFAEIIARFLLLGKTETQQKNRFDEIGLPFLKRSVAAIEGINDNSEARSILLTFIKRLKYTKLFLDPESCVYVLQMIKDYIAEYMPMEKYFAINCQLRVIVLYGETLKQCVAQKPESFEDKKIKNNDSVELIAYKFGKIIAQNIEELVLQNFQSIRNMYMDVLNKSLWNHILINIPGKVFLPHFIKGLIDDSTKINGVLVGVYVYHVFVREYEDSDVKEQINNIAESSIEVKCFFNANRDVMRCY